VNIYSIYKATNTITGKIYIGFTGNFQKRIKSHFRRSKNKKHNYKLYESIRKYGWESFVWEEIYQSTDDLHTKNVIEPLLIAEYNSYHTGYNSTLGGDGGRGRFTSEYTKSLHSRSYEEKCGEEKAKQIKEDLSKNHPANDKSRREEWIQSIIDNHPSKKGVVYLPHGTKHHNYDERLYTLQHKHTKEIVTSTQREFLSKYHSDYRGGNFSTMVKGDRKSFRGWRLISIQS
jgi:group I intron endonuclease